MEITEVQFNGQRYLIRAEQGGTPQGIAIASVRASLLATLWRGVVRGERGWFLRVRRFGDDPLGPVLHEEHLESRDEAARRLDELTNEIRHGRADWLPSA